MSTVTWTSSPTVTRRRDTAMDALNPVLPSESTMAQRIIISATAAMASSSCQRTNGNPAAHTMPMTTTVQPSGDMNEVKNRLTARLQRRHRRAELSRRLWRADLPDACWPRSFRGFGLRGFRGFCGLASNDELSLCLRMERLSRAERRRRHGLQHPADGLVRRQTGEGGFGGELDAVRQHGDRQILDIVRHHVSAPVGGRPDARAAVSANAPRMDEPMAMFSS